jgi:hypothetical protein
MALPTVIEPLDTFRRGDTPTPHERVMSCELWSYAVRVMNVILMIIHDGGMAQELWWMGTACEDWVVLCHAMLCRLS